MSLSSARAAIEELRLLASRLSGKVVQNINSTFTGGGVAEILSHMVPLLGQLGIDARWSIIKGDTPVFPGDQEIPQRAARQAGRHHRRGLFALYGDHPARISRRWSWIGDIIFVHDPQPAGLVALKKETGKKWIWRCHIDMSHPNPEVWNFLEPFVVQYDAAVFSAPAFCRSLPIRQFLISPSIDPLSDKNIELTQYNNRCGLWRNTEYPAGQAYHHSGITL